jgi:putative transposase
MARIARLVVPGLPHHITQRGNGGQKVFFADADYELYMALLADSCAAARVKCLAFALMPNHLHAILVPSTEDGLRAALAPVHRHYAGAMNARRRRTGHFWQGRYGAAVMDENHLAAAFRYILRNPVKAGLAKSPAKWPWSSAAAYLKGIPDGLTDTRPMLSRFPDIASLLSGESDDLIRDDETIGRPLGSKTFIARIEKKTGRTLQPARRGPKPKAAPK